MAYQWDFSPVLANAPLLAQGLANTLKITGTALVCGVVLGLGLALLRPSRLPRVRALVEASKQALPLIYGAALLTTLAAFVEGFWSAQGIPSDWKYLVGIIGWVLHIAYFLLAGRRSGHAA